MTEHFATHQVRLLTWALRWALIAGVTVFLGYLALRFLTGFIRASADLYGKTVASWRDTERTKQEGKRRGDP